MHIAHLHYIFIHTLQIRTNLSLQLCCGPSFLSFADESRKTHARPTQHQLLFLLSCIQNLFLCNNQTVFLLYIPSLEYVNFTLQLSLSRQLNHCFGYIKTSIHIRFRCISYPPCVPARVRYTGMLDLIFGPRIPVPDYRLFKSSIHYNFS